MKWLKIILFSWMTLLGYASAQTDLEAVEKLDTNAIPTISEEEYSQVSKRILDRITALKTEYPTLSNMNSPDDYEYNLTWTLNDPTKPHGKTNARMAVYGKDGYWFKLHFYRGQYEGAADFIPIEFGDLKLWFQYGHHGNAKEIAAVTTILREENEAFCKKHPWQKPNQPLMKTAKAAQ